MKDYEHQQISRINMSMARVSNLYEDWAKAHGIPYSQLRVLYKLNSGEVMTQRKLSTEHHIPKQTINNIVKRLMQQGYIQLQSESGNEKEKLIVLTIKGAVYVHSIIDPLMKIEQRIIQRMGKTATDALIQYSDLFGDIFEHVTQESGKL